MTALEMAAISSRVIRAFGLREVRVLALRSR